MRREGDNSCEINVFFFSNPVADVPAVAAVAFPSKGSDLPVGWGEGEWVTGEQTQIPPFASESCLYLYKL